MPLLEVSGLNTGYGSLPVLHDVDLGVAEGEVAVLLGLNGAGKTTTINTLAGLHRPWSGQIRFDDVDVTNLDSRRRVEAGVVLIPEGRHVFYDFTVAQNLRLGAWAQRKDRKRTTQAIEQVVDYFPVLRERWQQRAGTLSGGEQQMLAIARGLMAQPRLLLIDEASLGLSPKLTKTLFEIVDRINADGTTVFMVEQNAGVLEISDSALVMEKGTLVYTGSGEDIIDHAQVRQAYLGAPA